MKVIIIEDENITAEDLIDTILNVKPEVKIVKTLSSVKEAINYFKSNPLPDLIFSDIQLGDGLSFEIFNQVKIDIPVIFCTAYDEYALNAFQVNSIHYILKPFDTNAIKVAFEKFKNLKNVLGVNDQTINNLIEAISHNKPTNVQSSILVFQQDKVIPIKFTDIALFYIKNEVTHLLSFNGHKYYINKSLDDIQQIAGSNFYRANRQYIINRESIKSVSQTLSRKVSVELTIPIEDSITVSKEKMTDFLDWLKS